MSVMNGSVQQENGNAQRESAGRFQCGGRGTERRWCSCSLQLLAAALLPHHSRTDQHESNTSRQQQSSVRVRTGTDNVILNWIGRSAALERGFVARMLACLTQPLRTAADGCSRDLSSRPRQLGDQMNVIARLRRRQPSPPPSRAPRRSFIQQLRTQQPLTAPQPRLGAAAPTSASTDTEAWRSPHAAASAASTTSPASVAASVSASSSSAATAAAAGDEEAEEPTTAAAADADTEEAAAAPTVKPPASASISSDAGNGDLQPQQLTFSLQVVSDRGLVLCPGFQRGGGSSDGQHFTSAALLATIRSSSAPQSQAALNGNGSSDLPAAAPSSPAASSPLSPTVLPPSPLAVDGASAPAPPIAEELTISFTHGTFSLVDAPPSSSSAAAASVLKRLSLPAWLSPAGSATAVLDSGNAPAFPPASVLPEAVDAEVAATASRRQEGEEDRKSSEPDTVRQTPADSDAAQKQRQHAATEEPAAASSTEEHSDEPVAVPAVPAAPSPPAPQPWLSSLPVALWSSISSFLFPSAALSSSSLPAAASSDAAPPPPPSPPPPPPPPPPYASTLHRIVIIGIHGWSLLGGMLGEKAQLVSSRFCFLIQQATLHYYRQHHPQLLPSLSLTCIPLFGHGRVEDRVAMYLETQLPQYAEELQHADHLIVSCHSQGCMVTSALLFSLLTSPAPGLSLTLSPRDVTVLMMGGLHHGPFPDLPGDLYSGTKELFLYAHSHSSHAQQHLDRVQALLSLGVKLMLVGSVHDGVVPLYSSLAHLLGSNRNIVRALYVDYAHYAPDFLYSLLSLLLFLTNRTETEQDGGSVSQHSANDVLPHLSGFVRGSLLEKQGGAHSAMHRCTDLYGLAVEWAMSERTQPAAASASAAVFRLRSYSAALWSSQLSDAFTTGRFNRHMLLIRVREMMEELKAVRGLEEEAESRRLTLLFKQWQPKTRNLKSMKDTLQPIFAAEQQNGLQLQSNL